MKSKSSGKSERHIIHLPILLAGIVIASILIVMIILGHQEWEKQSIVTQEFKNCIMKAPFKSLPKANSPQSTLQPEDLQKHYDEFNQIFDATGLPPIWNGQKLIPWKEYHQESIKIAQQCHEEIGISDPQKELHGPYSKPVWDPNSSIWKPEESKA